MDNFSRKRRYPINSFIFRVSIHYDDYFPKDTCQYYLDITLPYEYKYKYLQEDITSIFPSLLHINTGVISYELCRPKDIDQ